MVFSVSEADTQCKSMNTRRANLCHRFLNKLVHFATYVGHDPFMSFADHARSILTSDQGEAEEDGETETGPGWSWVVARLLKTCKSYSSGVTPAILLSDLFEAWGVQRKSRAPKKRPEIINQIKRKNKQRKLLDTVTIDSVHEKSFLSVDSVLEAIIVDVFLLPGTKIVILRLGDIWSFNTIELYLHRRFYDLVDHDSGILRKGREIVLTGCSLRSANKGCGVPRLLPTEYLVILLDDDVDDDVMQITAQFCSDTFASVTHDGASNDISYSLYTRIISIGPVESKDSFNGVKWRTIILEDNCGAKMKFLLWGEQVILGRIFSIGSMLAVDKPYVGSLAENAGGNINEELCLEYGSATQLYMVPYVQQEEQASVQMSISRYEASTVSSELDHDCQCNEVSQVKLLCDSQGFIDFSNYPVRLFVSDLCDKMTSVSLYGTVLRVVREKSSAVRFSLKIKDLTGEVCVNLQFRDHWSLGRVGVGHIIFMSGLSSYKTKQGTINLSWFDDDAKASFVNLSCLPAVLNSSCLHKITRFCDLSPSSYRQQVCQVQLDNVNQCRIDIRLTHSRCGNRVNTISDRDAECSFCQCSCDSEIMRSFVLETLLSDETTTLSAWCIGQTASELLQISPDEFCDLSEDEQLMYPCSLESEKFVVCLVNSKRENDNLSPKLTMDPDNVTWEITRALRYDM